ncbi:hypothetical protein OIE43_43605 [Streptomyces pseudovenezuelae]|uniref:hypothetical protein n=1 Tax=Streptomyces pseudovenezuelae TaxID=67350 RepID=UPI002E369415|nr:hypothetical protein [Streptomyces pseudovenezuelae]
MTTDVLVAYGTKNRSTAQIAEAGPRCWQIPLFPFHSTTGHLGVDHDSGLIVIGGKIVNVPSSSPLYANVEEVAQQLQQAGIAFNGQDHDLLHRGGVRAMSSLADLLYRMETPREPHDVIEATQIPPSPAQAAAPSQG